MAALSSPIMKAMKAPGHVIEIVVPKESVEELIAQATKGFE